MRMFYIRLVFATELVCRYLCRISHLCNVKNFILSVWSPNKAIVFDLNFERKVIYCSGHSIVVTAGPPEGGYWSVIPTQF